MSKKRVLAGMRPTNFLHIGNYFGAAKGMIELQNDPEYETFYMVANLHAITTPYDSNVLPEATKNIVLDYLSAGLDPEKSAVFVQSDLADLHAQLAFYLSSVVTVARMQHLPTFKEKVKQHPDNVTMALLNYPVLMAGDILMYKADAVPVGIDQEPHIEVSREIARKMNAQYGMDFPEPKRFTIEGGEYIPSLSGEGKMSKSVEGSYIALSDDLEMIKKRLSGAPTDSGKGSIETIEGKNGEEKKYVSENGKESGGVSNLLALVELFEGKPIREYYDRDYEGNGIGYGDLKSQLAEAIYKELKPIQERRAELEKDDKYIEKVLKDGAEKARIVASETVREVKEKMGL